ncbi:acyl-CoA dehydrogenase [bacterium]|nr:acyl-CoA dehydrogenase [bacterium]
MDFTLEPHYQQLRDAVRDFAENEIKPRARELDEKEQFSPELTRKMGELGLFGIVVPTEYGGQGMDYMSYALVCEELARVDGSHAATVTAHNSLGCGPLYYFGNDEQRKKYLPQLGTGQALWAFGLTEPSAGSDSRGSKTVAKKVDGGWVINGSKIFITNGSSDMCAGVTVQTVTGQDAKGRPEFTCFIVEKGNPGWTAKPLKHKMMWRASDTSELYFNDCFVTDDAMLGAQGSGSRQMLETLDSGKIGIAAMGVGAAQGAFEAATAYAKERKQFGQPIANFQAIAFKLADMEVKIQMARTYLHKVCWMRDRGMNITKEGAIAKLYASEIAKEVCDEAVQIHGGYGLMKEYDVERFYRDQRLLQIGEGTSEVQRLIISRAVLTA